MGSRGGISFDLNEPPAEEEDEKGSVPLVLPQMSLPTSNLHASILLQSTEASSRIVSREGSKQKEEDSNADEASTCFTANRCDDSKVSPVDREEGELCDMDGNDDRTLNVEIEEKHKVAEDNECRNKTNSDISAMKIRFVVLANI
ncbi:uncharacterized protein A4U43_C10F11240 [Asparagus officinalis]|uniref:Uncharacterized protein n=1 Tax=Asparagus officinalis TaxID=4686 RepID=A0A5P1E210_ASPOF|nr:uncharacterized protein A4U43_C10F11240 [Asparagus officinalis]